MGMNESTEEHKIWVFFQFTSKNVILHIFNQNDRPKMKRQTFRWIVYCVFCILFEEVLMPIHYTQTTSNFPCMMSPVPIKSTWSKLWNKKLFLVLFGDLLFVENIKTELMMWIVVGVRPCIRQAHKPWELDANRSKQLAQHDHHVRISKLILIKDPFDKKKLMRWKNMTDSDWRKKLIQDNFYSTYNHWDILFVFLRSPRLSGENETRKNDQSKLDMIWSSPNKPNN